MHVATLRAASPARCMAVQLEEDLGERAHRIAAHRALALNPGVPKVSERNARWGLLSGVAQDHGAQTMMYRSGGRWNNNPAVSLLVDCDFVVQALFAEQSNTSLQSHKSMRTGISQTARATNFEKLIEIWDRILPHRKLETSGDDIIVKLLNNTNSYRASEMSDGERAIFYLIAQTLLANNSSVIIFDEPELHIHRAIMSRLWDELEAARPDCAMVLISHDLEFVASRRGQKYVLANYTPSEGWEINSVPEDTWFSEEITTLILGSRKPIIFVEGNNSSLDQAIFRACYSDWTVVPRGSCEQVVHAVVTMRANPAFTRIYCSGIVDADGFDDGEKSLLGSKGIEILPVSEVENLFLLPTIAEAIARSEGYQGAELNAKLREVSTEFFDRASDPANQNPMIKRYCIRKIDRSLKKIDLSNEDTIESTRSAYTEQTNSIDVYSISEVAKDRINAAISARDICTLLKWYDNKGILSIACKLKGNTKIKFEEWVIRAMRNDSCPSFREALKSVLPNLPRT